MLHSRCHKREQVLSLKPTGCCYLSSCGKIPFHNSCSGAVVKRNWVEKSVHIYHIHPHIYMYGIVHGVHMQSKNTNDTLAHESKTQLAHILYKPIIHTHSLTHIPPQTHTSLTHPHLTHRPFSWQQRI